MSKREFTLYNVTQLKNPSNLSLKDPFTKMQNRFRFILLHDSSSFELRACLFSIPDFYHPGEYNVSLRFYGLLGTMHGPLLVRSHPV